MQGFGDRDRMEIRENRPPQDGDQRPFKRKYDQNDFRGGNDFDKKRRFDSDYNNYRDDRNDLNRGGEPEDRRSKVHGNASPSLWVGTYERIGEIFTLTEEQLTEVFGKFGELFNVKLYQPKNCAFVNFLDVDAAVEAARTITGTEVNGIKILVNFAKAQKDLVEAIEAKRKGLPIPPPRREPRERDDRFQDRPSGDRERKREPRDRDLNRDVNRDINRDIDKDREREHRERREREKERTREREERENYEREKAKEHREREDRERFERERREAEEKERSQPPGRFRGERDSNDWDEYDGRRDEFEEKELEITHFDEPEEHVSRSARSPELSPRARRSRTKSRSPVRERNGDQNYDGAFEFSISKEDLTSRLNLRVDGISTDLIGKLVRIKEKRGDEPRYALARIVGVNPKEETLFFEQFPKDSR